MRACHLTSVHHRNDTRIFLKEIPSLVKAGFDVSAIVADGKGVEQREGHTIYDVGNSRNRIQRILSTTKKVLKKAIDLNAEIYHFHDPELIPVGLNLIKKGKKVIYDVHEDVPRDIISKEWLPGFLRKPVANRFEKYENKSVASFNYIITATPFILKRFKRINQYSEVINNFPVLNELVLKNLKPTKVNMVCYIGDISRIRAASEMIKALNSVDVQLFLAGSYETESIEKELKELPEWKKVLELGFINRQEAARVLSQSKAGQVIFYPEPNHIDAQPNKIFEYMSAGLPVIGSEFTLWKEIIEGNQCGICINPMDPKDIGKAINYIINHPQEAEQMGRNGRKSIEEKYNWGMEEIKLIDIYNQLKEN